MKRAWLLTLVASLAGCATLPFLQVEPVDTQFVLLGPDSIASHAQRSVAVEAVRIPGADLRGDDPQGHAARDHPR